MKKDVAIPMPWQLAGVNPQTPVLLALSGGADSRFLLDRLAKGSRRDGFPLLLAHVHHGIRGESADRDAQFCRALAEQYDLPIELLSVNVPALAKQHGRGIEEEAREVRYRFFEKLMRGQEIPLLATAHQADDLLETMLFRIARGTGTAGLCSISPVRPFANGFLTRPLLCFTAAEIRTVCKKEKLEFVEDETNANPAYARNLIRAQVIPALEKLYPQPQKQAVKLAARLRQDEDCLNGQVEAIWQEEFQNQLPCALLSRLHPAIRMRVLTRFLAEHGITADSAMLERMSNLATGRNGRRFSLSRSFLVAKRKENLVIEQKTTDVCAYHIRLTAGENRLPGNITIFVGQGKKQKPTPKNAAGTEWDLQLPNLEKALFKGYFWRTRSEGDVLLRGGHHKKLRRLWREAGVPDTLRDHLPLLCDEAGIVWAPYVGFAEEIEKESKTET